MSVLRFSADAADTEGPDAIRGPAVLYERAGLGPSRRLIVFTTLTRITDRLFRDSHEKSFN